MQSMRETFVINFVIDLDRSFLRERNGEIP